MVVHRDHGWSDGWGDPFFTTTEVDALTNSNDNLPVVLSINCASAQYDTDETSFVQNALVKPTGGAVGVFGDTRNSPSWSNSQLALGFVDALLPTVLSGEGPATKQRMGDALIHGKLRLAGLAPPSGPGIVGGNGDTRNELYLWHYFGDPTMQMFGGGHAPLTIGQAAFTATYKPQPVTPGDPPPFQVNVTLPGVLAGQPISLLRNGQVIGKAIAGDGSVTIAATFTDGVGAEAGRARRRARRRRRRRTGPRAGDGRPGAGAAGPRRQRADPDDDHRLKPGRFGRRPVQREDRRQQSEGADVHVHRPGRGRDGDADLQLRRPAAPAHGDRRLRRAGDGVRRGEQRDADGHLRLPRHRHGERRRPGRPSNRPNGQFWRRREATRRRRKAKQAILGVRARMPGLSSSIPSRSPASGCRARGR